jgi:hypothetical protein
MVRWRAVVSTVMSLIQERLGELSGLTSVRRNTLFKAVRIFSSPHLSRSFSSVRVEGECCDEVRRQKAVLVRQASSAT